MKEFQHISGKNKGNVIMYALSTCVWCKKTKKLLEELGVDYSYVNMDQLDKEVEAQFLDELKKWNPSCSYPTLVLNNKECIVGFDEDRIKEVLR